MQALAYCTKPNMEDTVKSSWVPCMDPPKFYPKTTSFFICENFQIYGTRNLHVYMYSTRQEKVSVLSLQLPVLLGYFCQYFSRVYFQGYYTVHVTRVKKVHNRGAAVHTKLTSGFVDRCLYCCCTMYQACFASLCFTSYSSLVPLLYRNHL